MGQHTPGPWFCTYTSNHAHDYRLTKAGGQHMPVNAACNDHSEQRANARLIAAAPELLEALTRVTQEWNERKFLTSATRQAVVSAIAKAEGRS